MLATHLQKKVSSCLRGRLSLIATASNQRALDHIRVCHLTGLEIFHVAFLVAANKLGALLEKHVRHVTSKVLEGNLLTLQGVRHCSVRVDLSQALNVLLDERVQLFLQIAFRQDGHLDVQKRLALGQLSDNHVAASVAHFFNAILQVELLVDRMGDGRRGTCSNGGARDGCVNGTQRSIDDRVHCSNTAQLVH